MTRPENSLRRHATRLVAMALVVIAYSLARQPVLSNPERVQLASRFRFSENALPQLPPAWPGHAPQTIRNVNPSLTRIAGWISALGAAAALGPDMPTYRIERPQLPLLRFLEEPKVYFPNVELVVDVELSTVTDPYLNDHQLQGVRLLPSVMGLEAMAEAAMALTGSSEPPAFENVKFLERVVVSESEVLRIRLAALVVGPGRVKVALLSEETAFKRVHFAADCRFDKEKAAGCRDVAASSF